MKILVFTISILFIFGSCASYKAIQEDPVLLNKASKRTFETTKDIVWRSVVSSIADRNFTIHSSDQYNGIIKATRTKANSNADTQRILLGVSADSGTVILSFLIEEIKPNVIDVKLNITGQLNSTEVGAFRIENKRVKPVSGVMTVDVLNKWFELISSEIERRK